VNQLPLAGKGGFVEGRADASALAGEPTRMSALDTPKQGSGSSSILSIGRIRIDAAGCCNALPDRRFGSCVSSTADVLGT